MRLCEITLKKEKVAGGGAGSKRPNILHRSIKVPELKSAVRLKVSTEGMQIIQSAGGLIKFLEQRDEKKLSKKLRSLKQKLLAQGIIKVSEPAKAEEEAPPAETAEAAAEAPEEGKAEKAEEKAEKKETKSEEASEAKPAEEKAGDQPAEKEESKAES